MSELYPKARQLGLKPSKPLPASRPARPAKPIQPSKGAQQKVQMKTPWDRSVTVAKDMENDKLRQGYKFVKHKTVQPQGLNKPRPATKPARANVGSKGTSFDVFKEMKSLQEIIESIERERQQ